MSVVVSQDRIQPVTGTSYVDVLGLAAGLERLPGEDAAEFAERIDLAVSADRGPGYEGLLNNLAIELGLEMRRAVRVSADAPFTLKVLFGELRLNELTIPLITMSCDDFWEWKPISAVASEIAAVPGFRTEVLGDDGPALQLMRQSNQGTVLGEALASGSRSQQLASGEIVPGSVVFDGPAPEFSIGADGRSLHFDGPPADGLAVSYRYRRCPYDLVASPAAAFSLTDPQVRARCLGANGRLIYQAREYLQEILRRDGSYWGK
jgi:hypothetical protein